LIKIENLSKSVGHTHILKGITLRLKAGEVCALIGPSGSGKTSLLRCINFLDSFQEGCITIDSCSLTHSQVMNPTRNDRELIRKLRLRVGMVFQNFHLFPHMTVLKNIVEAPIRVMKMQRKDAEDKAFSLLQRVRMQDKAHAYPSTLSGGEQQRAAIARALALNPQVLLLDEPTSSLDPELVGEVLEVVEDLTNDGITMLIVTHEMGFARETATRVIVMDDGRVIEDAHPRTIFSCPQHQRTKLFLSRVIRQ